jgi:hypothetical protein
MADWEGVVAFGKVALEPLKVALQDEDRTIRMEARNALQTISHSHYS